MRWAQRFYEITKIEYMKFNFSKSRNRDKRVVRLVGQDIPKSSIFWYYGSIIHKDGEIEDDVNHRIRTGWMK